MSRLKHVVALQTGHLLSARWPEQHPSPLSVTSLISRAQGCSLQTAGLPSLQHLSPPGSTHAQFLFPCQAAESSAVWDSSKSSASEKREHMSIHYIFIHTLRHVPTPETHTVCSDFLTPACFANLLSTPSIPSLRFIRILFKGNAAYCKLETLTSGQQTIY